MNEWEYYELIHTLNMTTHTSYPVFSGFTCLTYISLQDATFTDTHPAHHLDDSGPLTEDKGHVAP